MGQAIGNKNVTCDFARLMQAAPEIKCSEFADELIKALQGALLAERTGLPLVSEWKVGTA